jgi:hypothetical protein
MADFAGLQRTLQKELKQHARKKPLFLETRGSVWGATKLPIAFFSTYAGAIYVLNYAGLGTFSYSRAEASIQVVTWCTQHPILVEALPVSVPFSA